MVSGADTYQLIHTFATGRHDWLKGWLSLPSGTPTEDTFERIFQVLDPGIWQRVFQERVQTLPLETLARGEPEMIAFDDKTSCHAAPPGAFPLHTVGVYSVQQGLVLSTGAVPENTNEVTVISELLQVIAPVGAIITSDASECHKDVVWTIRQMLGDDYLLAVKGNHPKLQEEARRAFAYHDQHGWEHTDHSYACTFDPGHRHVEQRECWLLRDTKAVEQAEQWRDLRALVRVRATRTVGAQTGVEERLYVSSLQGEADEALRASHLHWGAENSSHSVLDVVFGNDASRARLENARRNWVALRHLALAILRRDTSFKGSLRSQRYRAAIDIRYLQHLLALQEPWDHPVQLHDPKAQPRA